MKKNLTSTIPSSKKRQLFLFALCLCVLSIGAFAQSTTCSQGQLFAWGADDRGQLGNNAIVVKQLTPVPTGVDKDWKTIAAGRFHTVALKTDGSLWAWGSNVSGQLGDGTLIDKKTPTKIGSANDWKEIAVSHANTFAIKTDGTLWAWGANGWGHLGIGIPEGGFKNIPVQIGTDNNWKAVATNEGHVVALKTDGTLWTWGFNSIGQLGDGTTLSKSVPTKIGTDMDWVAVAVGELHTVALKSNGTIWSWGHNGKRLSTGTTTDINVPVQTGTENNWKTIAANNNYTMALKIDGTLWGWGSYPGRPESTVFTPVQTDGNWKEIAAGYQHVSAIKTDGTLWAWSNVNDIPLGNITRTVPPSAPNLPHQISLETTWTKVAAGGGFTVAMQCSCGLAVIQGDNTVCRRSSITLTGLNANGTKTWASSNNTIATVSPTGLVTGMASGETTISYTVKDGDCTTTAFKTIKVNEVRTSINPGSGTITDIVKTIILTASGGGSYLWSTSSRNAAITVNTAGTYSVKVTGANGCTDTKLVNINGVNSGVLLMPMSNGDLMFPVNPILQNPSYRWFLNGNLINGAVRFMYTPTSAGTYRCEAMGFLTGGAQQTYITNNYVKQ
jgi:trimeric autotransporter adhesin